MTIPLIDFLRSLGDYRRFYRRPAGDRSIVFYAETGHDFHHFAPIIELLTGKHNRVICYITSKRNDPVFSQKNPRVHPFYIRAGLLRIIFFQFLKCDLFVLTMTDLGTLHLKRSINPVHYVYLFHAMGSTHMVDFANSYDGYDTILCAGPHQMREIRRREELAGLPPKKLLEHGYGRLDALIEENHRRGSRASGSRASGPEEPITVLLAPTWGENSILPLCGRRLVSILLTAGFKVILRPHWQTVRLTPEVVNAILDEHKGNPKLIYEDRMGDTESLFSSDLLICDWSSTSIEYALGLEKPVLFIDVPRRVRNPHFNDWGMEPLEMTIRDEVGKIASPSKLEEIPSLVTGLIGDPEAFRKKIETIRKRVVFNVGKSAEVGAEAIARVADEMGV